MATQKGRAWKLERASVHNNRSKPRSNKYSKSDTTEKPKAGARGKAWVGGYSRSDGTRVKGHFRAVSR